MYFFNAFLSRLILEGHFILIDTKKLEIVSSMKKSIVDFVVELKAKYCFIPKIFSFEKENELSIDASFINSFFDKILK